VDSGREEELKWEQTQETTTPESFDRCTTPATADHPKPGRWRQPSKNGARRKKYSRKLLHAIPAGGRGGARRVAGVNYLHGPRGSGAAARGRETSSGNQDRPGGAGARDSPRSRQRRATRLLGRKPKSFFFSRVFFPIQWKREARGHLPPWL
jgi:hypothetical protein